MQAELALRLRAEALIAGFRELDVHEAIGALADIEAAAAALAGTGALGPDVAESLVADTVDALVVRGASWVEPTAVDLDVRRLYDLVAGVARPRLRRVVPVGGGGPLTSVDLWDDRAEVRVAGGPSLHLDGVAPGERTLELRDERGDVVTVDLSGGRGATDGGTVVEVHAAEHLARLEAHAVSVVCRDGSVETLNAQRRRLAAVGEVLGDDGAVARFDDAVAAVEPPSRSTVLEVVPVAVRAALGWVLAVERWSDHWRMTAIVEGRGMWSAVDDAGNRYGGDPIDVDVVRFDPALPEAWRTVTVQFAAGDGRSIEVEVPR